jgi:hypothetical protein
MPGVILARFCIHGVQIEGPRAKRARGCLSCHVDAAAAARKRSAARRAAFTKEEREAFLQYFRDYGQKNKARIVARARLLRAEKRLIRALGTGDENLIAKRRYQLALLQVLIFHQPFW